MIKNTRSWLDELFKKSISITYLLRWLFLSVLLGILVGITCAGFLQSLEWITNYRENHKWIIALLPIAGLAIGCLYHYWGKEVEGGNNLLIDTIHQPQNKIPIKMLPFVYVGTIITHLFGGSAGREGTALQMAGAIAEQIGKLFKLQKADKKTLLIAAVAAGFGGVFGTPISGAIFGLEFFLVGIISYQAIFPAFIAAIVSDATAQFLHTHHTIYPILSKPTITFFTLLYALIAGILFGFCAAVFSKSIHWISELFKKQIRFAPLRPLIGGSLVALFVWTFGAFDYIGLGLPMIVKSFQQPVLPYSFLLKIVFTVFTIGSGFKGGEVTPLFFIGAALGNALALFIPLPFPLLAGMGFVAVFAGATNTPIACTILGMELFGAECGVMISIACITSYLFSGNAGIYHAQIIGKAKHEL